MARTPKQLANLKPPFTSDQNPEEASKNGKKGGKRSGQVRREKRDARAAARYILGLAAKGQIADNLKTLGLPEGDRTNMEALQARLFTMAMGGNLEAYKELMRSAGFDPEENRKERESVSSDKRKSLELDAKLTALGNNPNSNVSMSFGDEEGSGGVVIYLPEMEKEEDCEVSEPDADE